MTGKDALKQQFGFFYMTIGMNLEGFGAEDALVQPEPGGNCANWILAHLVDTHNAAMGLVGAPPVMESAELEQATAEPITSSDGAIDWGEMVTKLLGSKDVFLSSLDTLPDEKLDQGGFTDPFGNPTTRGQLLNLIAVHQNYHTGQLGIARRLVGLPGAIRNPKHQGASA